MKILKSGDLVIKNLLDLIVKGEMKPGDKLPSTESLAKTMGISTVSAREAVQSLATIGLLEISHGRGMFITQGAPVIEELFETRKVIESYSASTAASKIGAEALAEMAGLLAQMRERFTNGDIDGFTDLDYEFHVSIGRAAGNRILLKTLENIKDLLRYQQSTINKQPHIIESSMKRHEAIFEAIRTKNSDAAGTIMTLHITEVIGAWKKNILPGNRPTTADKNPQAPQKQRTERTGRRAKA